MGEEQEERDDIKIADRDLRIYLGECLLNFQRVDQITLSVMERYKEKAKYIANILEAVGIKVDESYKGSWGKIKFISKDIEVVNPKTGRREMKEVFKLGLTKVPELFMYTDPDKAVDVPPLKE